MVAKHYRFIGAFCFGKRKKSAWPNTVVEVPDYHFVFGQKLTYKHRWVNCCVIMVQNPLLQQSWLPHVLCRKNCLKWAERYVNIISNFSNSDSAIIPNHFLHHINDFIACWRQISSLIDWPSLSRIYHNRTCVLRAKSHNQYFKCHCTFHFIFYTKLNTVSLIHFFFE